MPKSLFFLSLCIFVVGFAHGVFADARISGYGSFVVGKTLFGDQYLADFPRTGIYDRDWSFSPDSSIGVQMVHDINSNYSLVIQLGAHGAREFEPEISWAYINYRISPELSVQLGRKGLPLYYYSDFFDLGYVYNWIRPPADNYTWQITHFNGLSFLYETQLGSWESSFTLYGGREDSLDNDLLGYLSGSEVDETWKNIVGVVAEFAYAQIDGRFTIMSSELDRSINGSLISENVQQLFSGFSLNLTLGNFFLMSEFNGYRRDDEHIDVHTRMLSLAYRIDDFTPYICYSKFRQKLTVAGGDEEHDTQSAGIRWDIYPDTAVKLQFDKIRDMGITSSILGDSESLSFGIDMVF